MSCEVMQKKGSSFSSARHNDAVFKVENLAVAKSRHFPAANAETHPTCSYRKRREPEKNGYNYGRWSHDEKRFFLFGLKLFGTAWPALQRMVKTRSMLQIRAHAQKYFIKLKKDQVNRMKSDGQLDGKIFLVTQHLKDKDFKSRLTKSKKEFIDRLLNLEGQVNSLEEAREKLGERKTENEEIELPELGYLDRALADEMREYTMQNTKALDEPTLLPRFELDGLEDSLSQRNFFVTGEEILFENGSYFDRLPSIYGLDEFDK